MKKIYLIAIMSIVCAWHQAAAQPKLSLNKPVKDSTTESSSYPPTNAVDTDTINSKWSSSYNYKQWLYVDLQKVCDIKKVTIRWADGYYAVVFDILFSVDSVNWTLAKTFPANTNGSFITIDDLSGQARYVKFQGRGRANASVGYRIADFAVYGYPVTTTAQQGEIDTLTRRIQARYTQMAFSTSEVDGFYNSILADGSWSDITYVKGGNWTGHAERLKKMALAYNKPGNKYDHQPLMRDKITSGLGYLLRKHPSAINWHDTVVAAPENYATALIILKNDINPDSLRLYATYLRDATDTASLQGMNKAWVSGITVHMGCILDSFYLVDKGFASMATSLNVVTGSGIEGPMADGSFHQHQHQLNTGGYGKMFVEYEAYYLRYSRGLSVNTYFTTTKRQTLSNLFLNGLQLMSYKKNVDFGSAGRDICKNYSTSMVFTTNMLDTMALNDTANAAAFLAWRDHANGISSFPAPYTISKFFWKSAILTMHGPSFYMSAKIISSRTCGTEGILDENQKGYNLPLGATNILRAGTEYKGIYPIWQWCRIPGTTAEMNEASTALTDYLLGTNDFGGGVSQNDGGVIAYEHNYNGIQAKKAYVFMNNQMICLGAGIYGSKSNEVVTSVDQAFSNGAVSYSKGAGTLTFTADSLTDNQFTWMHHNNIGYFFPQGGNMSMLNKIQTGHWSDIGPGSSASVSDTVFSVYFRHSATPANRHYFYIVAPDVSLSSMDSLYNNHGYSFPRNEADIQAVRSDGINKKYAVVFYAAGSIDMGDGVTITANQKTIVYIKEYSTTYRISVADPMYNQGTLTIKLNKQLTGSGASYAGGVTTINFTMPSGDAAGSTVTFFYTKVSGAKIALDATLDSRSEVDLSWQAADSLLFKGYQLEWGTDGKAFTPIYNELNHIDASTVYHHLYPVQGDNYYRLKLVDKNGQSTYSATQKIYTANGVRIYPNPAKDYVSLMGESLPSGNIRLRLLDAQGRFIKTVNAATRPVHIPTAGLPSGKYYLQLDNPAGGKLSYPFLIIR